MSNQENLTPGGISQLHTFVVATSYTNTPIKTLPCGRSADLVKSAFSEADGYNVYVTHDGRRYKVNEP